MASGNTTQKPDYASIEFQRDLQNLFVVDHEFGNTGRTKLLPHMIQYLVNRGWLEYDPADEHCNITKVGQKLIDMVPRAARSLLEAQQPVDGNPSPVHLGENGLWYFWDEVGSHAYGPFESQDDACRGLDDYCRQLDGVEAGEVWQHRNGHFYEIFLVARDDDKSTNRFIGMRGLHDGRVWVRPIANFLGRQLDGGHRFTKILGNAPGDLAIHYDGTSGRKKIDSVTRLRPEH